MQLPPPPTDAEELRRIEHTRLRRRLLYGLHGPDVTARIRTQMGQVRTEIIGEPDLTGNPFAQMWTEVAALHADTPVVLTAPENEPLVDACSASGLWQLMQRVERDTLGLREMLVRVDVDPATKRISFSPVYPDMVELEADPRDPSTPATVREWRATSSGWVRVTTSIADPKAPLLVAEDEHGRDVSEAVLGRSYTSESYPFVDRTGAPRLNYVVFHAAETGALFDPYAHREVVEGSLNICVLLTFYGHLVRNAAWSLRYVIGCRPRSTVPVGDGQTARVEAEIDPTSLVVLAADEGVATATAGQWAPAADASAILESIAMYERRIQSAAGFAPPDVTRQVADIRSGYSLAVSREAVRAAQRRFAPQFERADVALLAVAAVVANSALGTSYSETAADYRIGFTGVPESPDEVRLHLEQVKAEQDAGQIGPVTAYLRTHPLSNRDEAVAALAEVASERAEVDAATRARLAASGGDVAPPQVALSVGAIQAAATVVQSAASGAVPADTAEQMLVGLIGITQDAARAMIAPIRAAPPPPTPPPAQTGAAA